jgi:hypothetical protein
MPETLLCGQGRAEGGSQSVCRESLLLSHGGHSKLQRQGDLGAERPFAAIGPSEAFGIPGLTTPLLLRARSS